MESHLKAEYSTIELATPPQKKNRMCRYNQKKKWTTPLSRVVYIIFVIYYYYYYFFYLYLPLNQKVHVCITENLTNLPFAEVKKASVT